MSRGRLKAGSILDALLSLDDENDSDTNNNSNNNKNQNIHEELVRAEKLKLMNLPSYEIPLDILNVEKNKKNNFSLKNFSNQMSNYKMNESKYIEAYKTMIYFEEAAQANFLSQFNQVSIQIKFSQANDKFYIQINEQIGKINEAIDEGVLEQFTLKSSRASVRRVITGSILGKKEDKIFVNILDDSVDYVRRNCNKELYDIHFLVNRQPFQLQHNALKFMLEQKLFDCLIANPKYDDDTEQLGLTDSYTFIGQLGLRLNEEQRTAVINIVKAKSYPLPYLLFGPAGTGKTNTLAAAIEEIVRSSSQNVIVCANSNSACDEITQRLVNILNVGEIFRMYAKSYNSERICEQIKPICNWFDGEYHFPSLKFLYQFRVLVCTISTAGYFTRAREDPHFDPAHFSYVIIDECTSINESVTLIPIAGLCTTYKRIESSIIMAGDPKQLCAMAVSSNAIKLGFKTSLMEHLFERRLYKRDPISNKYNQKYITQLVKNYRSHSTILHVPNKLFYENKLEAMAPSDVTDWYIESEFLPSKRFPIIFQSVQGNCMRLQQDFSMFNPEEVKVVIDFIRKLLQNENGVIVAQSDIGVVSPYKLQCKKIVHACRQSNLCDVTIGTAEIFQGQEKPIMIVSTVRTNGKLGNFVSDPRRFNVVMTRAKCLLIVVGDAHTLQLDTNWKTFLQYCIQNYSFIQGEKYFNLP